jgi:hypothetical protein
MYTSVKSEYVKHTQKDYSLSFKLRVVEEIASGSSWSFRCMSYQIRPIIWYKKVVIFDMLVDMAEKEYDIQIRKNYMPELLKTTMVYSSKSLALLQIVRA